MKKNILKYVTVFYVIVMLGLFLYSFTQIDLSLTFSRITFLRNLVKSFQYIGYFNRPLSTYLFLALISLLYGFYVLFLYWSQKKKINRKFIWRLILISSIVLGLSYNAFSYDIFNYMFDAKIVTHYYQNPYQHDALDYPGDPMLSFMHWTQRTYPYGPIWLVLTLPLSFIGMNFFLPTFFLFKALMAGSYLGSIYFIGKILKKIFPEQEEFGLIFFGLNPLILIESLLSAHLDVVMLFFALFAFYFLLNKKYLATFLLLFLSIGIKFATGLLLPVFIGIFFLHNQKKRIPWKAVLLMSILLMGATVVLASLRTNFQPWYLILPLAFAAFLANEYYILIPSFVISLFALLTYAPFLYLGNWNSPVPQILTSLYVTSYVISLLLIGFYFIRKKSIYHKLRMKSVLIGK